MYVQGFVYDKYFTGHKGVMEQLPGERIEDTVGSYEWANEKIGPIPEPGLQKAQPLFEPSTGTFSNANIIITPAPPKSCKLRSKTTGLPGADPKFFLAPVWVSPPDDEVVNRSKQNQRKKIQKQKARIKKRKRIKTEKKLRKAERIKEFRSWVPLHKSLKKEE